MSEPSGQYLRAETLPDLLKVDEVAVYLRTTPGSVRQMIYRGTLPVRRIGSRVRVHREDLLALCRVPSPSRKEAKRWQ